MESIIFQSEFKAKKKVTFFQFNAQLGSIKSNTEIKRQESKKETGVACSTTPAPTVFKLHSKTPALKTKPSQVKIDLRGFLFLITILDITF
jgi:hypothetical protein